MLASAITTVFALAIISPTLNGAQERVCGITGAARELFWRSLGYEQTQPTVQALSFHEIVKTGSFEQIEAAIQAEKQKEGLASWAKPASLFAKFDDHGFAPIHYAAQRGDADILFLLRERGSAVDIRLRNTGMTPLHLAAQLGHIDVACILLREGANVNAQDAIKNTPAHYAFKNGHVKLGNYFIKNCRALGTLNRERKTPEQCAPELETEQGEALENKTD